MVWLYYTAKHKEDNVVIHYSSFYIDIVSDGVKLPLGRNRAVCINLIIPHTDTITNNAINPHFIILLPSSTAFSSPPRRKINLANPQRKARRAMATVIPIKGFIRLPTAVIKSLTPVSWAEITSGNRNSAAINIFV